jgi:hypothetical protein
MTNHLIPHDWKRNVINFDRWQGDAYGVYEYRARNYEHFFRFELQPAVAGTIRIAVLEQPGYGMRPSDFHSTHRWHDRSGRTCIDIHPDHAPRTVPEALAWAVYWAEQTSRYIDTGRWL